MRCSWFVLPVRWYAVLWATALSPLAVVAVIGPWLGVAAAAAQQPDGHTVQPLCQTGCGSSWQPEVLPHTGGVALVANQRDTVYFQVYDMGTQTGSYTFTCSATGTVGCVSVSPTSATLDPSGGALGRRARRIPLRLRWLAGSMASRLAPTSRLILGCGGRAGAGGARPVKRPMVFYPLEVDVRVIFTAGATGGTVSLKANGSAGAVDTGTLTVGIMGGPSAMLYRQNGTNLDCGACLTVGAGAAAAWQCGSLLVAHGMPGYATMGRERALTLVYQSAQAAPWPVVYASVTETSGRALPQRVHAELRINGVLRDSASYTAWSSASKLVGMTYDAASDSTGIYPFSLLVRNQYSTATFDTTLTGQVIVVNRTQSRYGAGWGLAGVEQLYLNQPNSAVLWVDGDGSARVYSLVSTNHWAGAAGDFPDTLVYNTGTATYTRTLRHGIQVVFNSSGRHTSTVNRVGQTTTFGYDGTGRLSSVTVPPGGTGTQYTVVYDGNGKLDYLQDPAGRRLDATVASGLLTVLTDADSHGASFSYGTTTSTRLMISQTGRRGAVTKYVWSGARLQKIAVPRDIPSSVWDTTTVQSYEMRGIAYGNSGGLLTAGDPTLADIKVDGPRTDVADTAAFLVDAWGAPTREVGAIGDTTWLTRGDAAHPELVTQLIYPNHRVVTLSYDARGNLTQQRDSTSHLANGFPTAVTRWTYKSANTADSPDTVIAPSGVRQRYSYNSWGLLSQATAPNGHATQILFDSVGTLKGVILAVIEKSVAAWNSSTRSEAVADRRTAFAFDALGNVVSDTSPLGRVHRYTRDSYERVSNAYDAAGYRTEYVYDLLNRTTDVKQHVEQAGNSGYPADSGYSTPLVAHWHWATDVVDSVIDPRGVKRTYAYNGRNQPVTETNDYGVVETRYYGPGGLVDSVRTRTGQVIRYGYDAAGRRTKVAWAVRNFPLSPDSVLNHYDVMGNLDTARLGLQGQEMLTRSFFPNGALKSEYDSYARVSQAFGYDNGGRRVWYRTGPANAPRYSDSVSYQYDATSGNLRVVKVRWRGTSPNPADSVAFAWDSLGRRRVLTYSNGATVIYQYDADGQMRAICGSHSYPNPAQQDVFTFRIIRDSTDARGLILATNTGGLPVPTGCDVTNNSPVKDEAFGYDSRGQLLSYTHTAGTDFYRYDGSGNRIRFIMTGGQGNYTYTDSVAAGHNRITWHNNNLGDLKEYAYDADGARMQDNPCGHGNDCAVLHSGFREYEYDGLGRTSEIDEGGCEQFDRDGTCELLGGQTFAHCNYDPVGRLNQPCRGANVKLAFDGNDVVRTGADTSSGGDWTFVHGPGTDDPILGYNGSAGGRAYIVTDGAGRSYAAGDLAGDDLNDTANPSLSAAAYQAYGGQDAGQTDNSQGFGADREWSTQATKLSFFRNRVYDQETGRWTQEDPLGVAGGVNLYQFNGNNPASYTDPFGLCPDACVVEGGVGAAAVLTGLAIAATAIVAGDNLGDALDQGYRGARDLVSGVVAAVSGKALEIQARGQMKPIDGHFNKLGNPNQPGGSDPRNRDKWKKDIGRAIDRLRQKVDKMKGKQRERWEETIRQSEEHLRNVE